MGAGVFDVVGTPRRWLWPVLRLLARQGILFPAWERNVPFTVVNRPLVDARGNTAVVAVRSFRFASGERRMVDAITAERGTLVDHLGTTGCLLSGLSGEVVGGALTLVSTTLSVRMGRVRIQVPRWISPVVTLVERMDDRSGRQHVMVTVDAPLIGRLYEYSGSFTYGIRTQS